MAGSFFGKLHRRYGPKLSGKERFERAHQKQQAFARRLQTATAAADCGNALPRGVAIVGAGFAGLAAAWTLRQAGIQATVFEARPRFGGRVETDRSLIPGRIIEAGAELIGLNHPMWLHLAREFGLGLTVLTGEDQYAGAGLEMPLRLKGAPVADREKLYDQMKFVFKRISQDAKAIADAFAPWTAPGAAALDAKSVADKVNEYALLIPAATRHPRLVDAIEVQLGNDNVFPMKDQSYLGLLALVKGGQFGNNDVDLEGYWITTEDFRCSEGNDRLAVMLHEFGRFKLQTSSPVRRLDIDENAGLVKVTWLDPGDGQLHSKDFDYVILAAPPSVWRRITITPALPAGMEMAMGPAVKYLSRVPGRFWIKKSLAPSGLSDELGQTWEGTENQTLVAQGVELTVFAGGVSVPATDGAKHFRTRLPTLYPGFSATAERYVDWPSVPFIEAGNVCPKLGQVTTIAKFYSTPFKKRVVFAGEHACMAFFGYMEGALQSGERAAEAVLSRCVKGRLASNAPPAPRERIHHEIERPELRRPAREVVAARESAQEGWTEVYPFHMAGAAAAAPTMAVPRARSWRWPSIAEEDTPPETPAVATPNGLVALSHAHFRRTCPDGKAFSSASSATTMSPATMNPGFLKADDTIEFDSALDAKLVALILDTPKYASMVSAESRRDRTPHAEDRLRVALVDLTGDKICKPGFAGWGSTLPMPGGSTPKVLILYAAHQIVMDLNEMARTGSIASAADLTARAATAWSGLTCKPDMNWLVDLNATGPRVVVTPSTKLKTHLKEMVNRSFSGVSVSRASELMLRLGFEYIASVTFQSGIRHLTRGGLWIGNTYLNASIKAATNPLCHSGSNPIVWSTNPLGKTGITITALSAATFFTLLAQRRLVSATASTEMETLLQTACGFVAVPGVTRRATKCGLTSNLSHDAVLMEGPGRVYALVVLTTLPTWVAYDAFIRDLDRLIKENNP